MKAALPGIAALAMAFAWSLPAGAHHSHPIFYDSCTSLTIEGEVESVQWKNPHVLIDLIANDGQAYRAEWTSAGILDRTSVEPPKAGDRVVVRGNPMRDEASIRARFPSLTLGPRAKPVVDLVQIRRVSDGWNWARAEPASQDCGRR
jgi:uncharacterized protein DUF6152